MCSHPSITWEIVSNNVADRMIDNSLIHKFVSSRKIRRRTKRLNTELKKYPNIQDYKRYVEIKTTVLRDMIKDADTDDTDNLTDIDYDIIYNSQSTLAKYASKNSRYYTSFISSSEENENEKNRRKKSRINNAKPKKKSEKYVNTGWQEIVKRNRSTRCLSDNRKNANTLSVNNGDTDLDTDYDYLKACSNKRSYPRKLDSREDKVCNKIKLVNKNTAQKRKDLHAVLSKSNSTDSQIDSQIDSQDDTTSSKIRSINKSNTMQKDLNMLAKDSNSELDYQDNISCKIDSESKSIVQKDLKTVERSNSEVNLADCIISNKSKSMERNIESNQRNLNVKNKLSPKLDVQDSDILSIKTKFANKDTDYRDLNLEINESNAKSDLQNNIISNKINLANKTAVQNRNNLSMVINKLKSKSNQDNSISCETKLSKKDISEDLDDDSNKSNSSLNLQSPNYGVPLCRSTSLKNVNNLSSSNNDELNSLKHSTQKLIKVNNKSLINEKNQDKSGRTYSKLLNNVKKNLISVLNNVDSTNDNKDIKKNQGIENRSNADWSSPSAKSPDILLDQQKDSGIDEDSQEKYIKQHNVGSPSNTQNTTKTFSGLSQFKKINEVAEEIENDCSKDSDLKIHNDILRKLSNTEMKEPLNDSPQLKQDEDKDTKINIEDKVHFVKSESSCDVTKKQLQLKVMSTEIVNTKYKIVSKGVNDECSTNVITSIDCPNITNDTDNSQKEATTNIEQDKTTLLWLKEIDNEEKEEEDAIYVSPKTKKRLQQQARLNLIIGTDSSESENENKYCTTAETSKSFVDNSDKSHCSESVSEDEKLKNDERNYISEKSITDISRNNEDIHKDISICEDEKLETSEKNYVSEKDNESSLIDKENICDTKNQCQNRTDVCELETQNVHLEHPSYRYRPCNLQELIEDQELSVETLPTSFTLADLSEDDEAFILNIPNKVMQSNLQGQRLILKDKTIKLNENKYRIVRKKIDTVTCIFATGKQRKPYKTINIKEFSTITIRERLHPVRNLTKSDHDLRIFFKSKLPRKHRLYDDKSEISKKRTKLH